MRASVYLFLASPCTLAASIREGVPLVTTMSSKTSSGSPSFLGLFPASDSITITVIATILVLCHLAVFFLAAKGLKACLKSNCSKPRSARDTWRAQSSSALLELSDPTRNGSPRSPATGSTHCWSSTPGSNTSSSSCSNQPSRGRFGNKDRQHHEEEGTVPSLSFEDNALAEILAALALVQESFSEGLSWNEAQRRFADYGPNALEVPAGRNCCWLFISALFGFTNSLLLVVAVLAFSNGSHPDAEIFVGVVFLSASLAAISERQAVNAATELQEQQSKTATCLRSGSWVEVAVEQLVPGDIVRLGTGQRVPADLRILESTELLVNEVVLTGEPIDRPKSVEVVPNQPVGQPRSNMLYASTDVTGGQARALVVYTGMKTRIGGIVAQLQQAGSKSVEASSVLGGPLQRAIDGFSKQLLYLCLMTFVLCMDVCIFTRYMDPSSICEQHHEVETCLWINSMYLSLLTCMRVIPQMLIPVCILCLNTAASRIRRVGGAVRKHGSIEAIGACSIICTDKTGTLTEGRMSCASIFACLPEATCIEVDMGQQVGTLLQAGQIEPERKEDICRKLLGLSTLNCCETTRLERPRGRGEGAGGRCRRRRSSSVGGSSSSPGSLSTSALSLTSTELPAPSAECHRPRVVGNATEVPIVQGALQGGLEPETLWQEYPALLDVPFTSSRKVRATVHRIGDGFSTFDVSLKEALPGATHFAVLKGAPDKLLPFLKGFSKVGLTTDEASRLPHEDMHELFRFQNAAFAARALRVLLVALVPLCEDEVSTLANLDVDDRLRQLLTKKGLELLCSIALWDPPRQGVADAVLQCRQAGIRVVMITGDQAPTAAAIGELININGQASLTSALHNASGEFLPSPDLQRHALCTDVWARAQPEDKIVLVSTLKGLNNTVAMTGDGVNDSPALVEADVGVAMGSGSSVAKQASAVVLVDDNFTSIVKCVEEGRRAFDNISKIVTYWLSINTAELLLNTSIFILCIPTPFSGANQQLCGLLTTTLGVLPLTREPVETTAMLEPPRPRSREMIPQKLWIHLILPMWAIFLVMVLSIMKFGLMYHVGVANNQSLDDLCSVAFHWNPMTQSYRKDEAAFHCRCPALGIEQWGRRQTQDNNLDAQFDETTGFTGAAYAKDSNIWGDRPLQACPAGAKNEFGKLLPQGAMCWVDSWLAEEACIGSDGRASSSRKCRGFENVLIRQDCVHYGTLLAKTMAWHVTVLSELAFLHCVRSPMPVLSTFTRNPYSIALLLLSLVLAEAGIYLPRVNEALNFAPLGLKPFCLTLACPVLLILSMEWSKRLAAK
mmetsp:Transcript_91166/g.190655  ORF Transcript_91166/g.190655 Transcript_91166/m.190655 type:complete len:1300 (-) Transcript_91166:18-3917(-)